MDFDPLNPMQNSFGIGPNADSSYVLNKGLKQIQQGEPVKQSADDLRRQARQRQVSNASKVIGDITADSTAKYNASMVNKPMRSMSASKWQPTHFSQQRRIKQQMDQALKYANNQQARRQIQAHYRDLIGGVLQRAKLQGWRSQGYAQNKDINKRNLVEQLARQNTSFAGDMGASMSGALGNAVLDAAKLPVYAYDAGQAIRNRMSTGQWKWQPTAGILYQDMLSPLRKGFQQAQGSIPEWQKNVQTLSAGLGLSMLSSPSAAAESVGHRADMAARLSRMRNVKNVTIPKTKFGVNMTRAGGRGRRLVPGHLTVADVSQNISTPFRTGSKGLQTAQAAKNFVATYFPKWVRSPQTVVRKGIKLYKNIAENPKQVTAAALKAGAKKVPKIVAQGVAATFIPPMLQKYFDQQRYQIANDAMLSQTQKQKKLQAMDKWQAGANTAVGAASWLLGRTKFGNKFAPTRLLPFQGITKGVVPLLRNEQHGVPITQQNAIKYRTAQQLERDIKATAQRYSKPQDYKQYLKRQAVQTLGIAPYMIPGTGYLMVPDIMSHVITGKSIPGHIIPGYDQLLNPGTTKLQQNEQLVQRQLPYQYAVAEQLRRRQAQARRGKTKQQQAAISKQFAVMRQQMDNQLRQKAQRNTGSGTLLDLYGIVKKYQAGEQLTQQQMSMFGNKLRSSPELQQKLVAQADNMIQGAFKGLRAAKTAEQRTAYIKKLMSGTTNKQLLSRLLQDQVLSEKSLKDISASIAKGVQNMSIQDMTAVADYAKNTKSQFGSVPPQLIQHFSPAIVGRMQTFVDNAKGQQVFSVSKKLLAIRSAFGNNTGGFDKDPQVQKLEQTIQAKSWQALKANPLLLHKAMSLWIRSKGMSQIADFFQNPIAFYGTLAVLIGAPVLMGFSAGQSSLQQPIQQSQQRQSSMTDLYATTLRR